MLYLTMRKLIIIWVMLLVAGVATAQDVITTKKNVAIRCIIEDVVDSTLIFRTTRLEPSQKLSLSLVSSVSITDSSKRAQLQSKSVLLSELIEKPLDSTSKMGVAEIPKPQGKELIQEGANLIYKGAGQILIGTAIGIATSVIILIPAVAATVSVLPIIAAGNGVSLLLNVAGFVNIRKGAKSIQEGGQGL